MKKQNQFYLIENYTEIIRTPDYELPPGAPNPDKKYKRSEVRGFDSLKKLQKAILRGPKHGGELTPAKLIQIKLEVLVG